MQGINDFKMEGGNVDSWFQATCHGMTHGNQEIPIRRNYPEY
jgi:hypothetical protein